ncbi:MAG: DUF3833 domain-containing protein [Oceanospirillales bacterium]|nr:DUF3833 domain-containing protein [Oceanospirillales bacterium]
MSTHAATDMETLKLEAFFDGKVYAWGLFEARFGQLKREFQVEIDGRWDGSTLRLEEQFLYQDGARDRRVWTIRPQEDGRYVGHAADLTAEAEGVATGSRLNWRYRMRLQTGHGAIVVRFEDDFFLRPGEVMINRARVSKWGIRLGEVTLFFCPARNLTAPPFML